MKRLLFILLLFMGIGTMAQTYDTLPNGSKPYGNQLYITPAGLIVGGTGSAKFRVIGTKKYVDSLLTLKLDAVNGVRTNGSDNGVIFVNGSIANTPIGTGLPSTGNFTSLNASVAATVPDLALSDSSNNAVNTKLLKQLIYGSVTKTGAQTLTNKTLTAPTINTPDITNGTANALTLVNGTINSTPIGASIPNTGNFTTVNATNSSTLELVSRKGAANGYASLGTDGKVPNAQIPALAISETFPVASQSAMLALSGAEQGDVAVRSDISKSFILQQSPASTLGNWVELLTPTDAVQSVNGMTGNVTITKSNVGLSNADNTSDSNKPVSTAQQNALNGKLNTTGGVMTGLISASGIDNFGNTKERGNFDGVDAISFNVPNYAITTNNNAVASTKFVQDRIAPGQTIGANTTGNAKLWGNYEFDTSDLGTDITWMMGLDATTGKVMPFSKSTIKSALNINNGTYLNNAVAAATDATNWGGRTADLNAVNNSFDYVLVRNSDAVVRLSTKAGFKSELATSFDDVTGVSGETTHPIKVYANSATDILVLGQNSTNPKQLLFQGNPTSNYFNIQGVEQGVAFNQNIALQASGGSVGVGTSTPTAKLHVVGNSVASGTSSLNAANVLTVIGSNGGNNTASTGFALGGTAGRVRVVAGNGGTSVTSSGTRIGGTGGDIDFIAGNGGNTNSTGLAGNAGNANLQAGSVDTGIPGPQAGKVFIKGGQNNITGGSGGGVYLIPGFGDRNSSGDGKNLTYDGNIFLGATELGTLRGATVVGSNISDLINDFQVNGKSIFYGTVAINGLVGTGDRQVFADANGVLKPASSSNLMTTNTSQTITGTKTFSNSSIAINGTGLLQMANGNNQVQIDNTSLLVSDYGVDFGQTTLNSSYLSFNKFGGSQTIQPTTSTELFVSNNLTIAGAAKASNFKLSALNTAPSSASDTGSLGEIRITADYIYVCVATNTWVRSALTTW